MTMVKNWRKAPLVRTFALAAFLLLLLPVHSAHALSCAAPEPARLIANGGSILFGTVTNVERVSITNQTNGGYQEESRVTMTVEKG